MRLGRLIISDRTIAGHQAPGQPVGQPPRQRLLVTHRTNYHFPNGAARLQLVLRLWPEPHAAQIVRQWQVSVNDVPVAPGPRTGYGDRSALWSAAVRPGTVTIMASGIIEVDDRAGLVTGLTVRPNPAIFLRATDATRADKAVREIIGPPPVVAEQGTDAGDAATSAASSALIPWLHDLMAVVHARLSYVSGSTTSETTAIEALKAGAGVCQDHAHLFIAAARAHGIPARYVCGYMLADGTHADLHETHAWAEVWVEPLGWIAFDPSSGICTTERYIRLTTGMDAFDAAPIRGHATGGSAQGVVADVRIARSDERTEAAMATSLRQQQQQGQGPATDQEQQQQQQQQ